MKIFEHKSPMWQVESPTFLISAAFAFFLVIAAHYFQKHWKPRFLSKHPSLLIEVRGKSQILGRKWQQPLSELSIDKSFTKKSQNWRLYNRIQIWLRTIKRSRLLIVRTIVIDMVDYCQLLPLTWSTIVKGPVPNTRGRPFCPGIVNFVIAPAQY